MTGTAYTIVATGTTEYPLHDVEFAVRDALAAVGFELVPCDWAPDPDTISDATGGREIQVVDLN